MKKSKKITSLLIAWLIGWLIFLGPAYAAKEFKGSQETLKLVTWNLENTMSYHYFQQWKSYCEAKNQQKSIASEVKLSFIYCDAHDGRDFLSGKRAYLPLDSWEDFKLKIAALKEVASQLDADIYAFQEFTDAKALALVVDQAEYQFFVADQKTHQNLGFAVRKTSRFTPEHFRTISDLRVKDRDKYVAKAGAELTLTVESLDLSIKFLNVHLKSGCKNYVIDNPKIASRHKHRAEKIKKDCQIFRQQVPPLRNWVDNNNQQQIPFVILGDFNRLFIWEFSQHLRFGKPARLSGSDSLDVAAPITGNTKIAYLFFELSHSNKFNEWLTISFPKRTVKKYLNRDRCYFGNNYIIINQALGSRLDNSQNAKVRGKGSSRLQSFATDYGDQHYAPDKALPSDHCPVVTRLNLKTW